VLNISLHMFSWTDANHSDSGIRLVCYDAEVCVTLQITVH
jgi:hypothetical protein